MNKIKTFALLLAGAVCLSACCEKQSAYPKAEGSIRLLQYNVGVFSKHMENSMPMLADIVQELQADIVGVNELDSCNTRHNSFQCEDFAKELGGWNYQFSRAIPYKGGAYGNGVVCPEAFEHVETIMLDKGAGSETRCAIMVETEKYVFLATHLDHKDEATCINQANTITAAVKARYADSDKPVFLAGDMNSTPDNIVMTTFAQDWNIISDTTVLTASCPNPKVCIDFILALKNNAKYEVLGSKVPVCFESGNVETASDHYPIFVDVKL